MCRNGRKRKRQGHWKMIHCDNRNMWDMVCCPTIPTCYALFYHDASYTTMPSHKIVQQGVSKTISIMHIHIIAWDYETWLLVDSTSHRLAPLWINTRSCLLHCITNTKCFSTNHSHEEMTNYTWTYLNRFLCKFSSAQFWSILDFVDFVNL